MYEADAEHGPGQRILGTEARVLLAVGQVGAVPDRRGQLGLCTCVHTCSLTWDRRFGSIALPLHVHVYQLPTSLPAFLPPFLCTPQVEDEDGIVEIQHAYDMCKHVFSAATGRLKNDHKTSMVGKAMIHTNPAAVALG